MVHCWDWFRWITSTIMVHYSIRERMYGDDQFGSSGNLDEEEANYKGTNSFGWRCELCATA